MKSLLYIIILCFPLMSFNLEGQNTVDLFPQPLVYTQSTTSGEFIMNSEVKFKTSGTYSKQIKKTLASSVQSYSSVPEGVSKQIQLDLNKKLSLPDGAYNLEVTPEVIRLESSTPAGLFYGAETLKQLFRHGAGCIAACKIEDAPANAWRGYMLDESRHFFGVEKVKQILDVMATLKLNVFHWHLTDEPGWRIEIKKYPLLTTVGSVGNWADAQAAPKFYTQEQIKELVKYAAARQIMIIPEIDMPGHATAACKSYPEVSSGGEGRWKDFTYNPCKDVTFEFLSNVLDEVVSLFPAPYIHLGADEVHYGNQIWYTDPAFKKFIKDNNLKDAIGLEHYFIRRVADMIYDKGKKAIGWDEMVDAGVSPEKAVIMWWRHDREYQLKKALDKGYDVILTPRRALYGDFVQHESHKIGRRWGGFNPIEDIYNFPGKSVQKVIEGKESQILGSQFTMWTERIADEKRLDFMTFPRLVAFAETAWCPVTSKNEKGFMQKLPLFLQYLDTLNIYYFDPFNPFERPEPHGPSKADVLQNG